MAATPTIDQLLRRCRHSAVHLEMRDGYMQDDAYVGWKAERSFDPGARWPEWTALMAATTGRGVQVRRARIVSEPISDYIRFEYDLTSAHNLALGEQVRWLPRRRATDLTLPGNDF